jgi:hypothetical protein
MKSLGSGRRLLDIPELQHSGPPYMLWTMAFTLSHPNRMRCPGSAS